MSTRGRAGTSLPPLVPKAFMSTSLLDGRPWRVILAFTVPLLIGNAVQQMYQVVDSIVVGRHLGVDSLAAVGATGSLLFLLIGFAWGMTAGFAIPTAQAFGAGDHAGVRRSVATGAVLTAAATAVVTIAAAFVTEPALRLMQTPPEILEDATTFAMISFLGCATTMFFNFLSAVIRAIGDSRTPLIFLVIACLLNVGLVIVLVVTFGMGVAGAAVATVAAQGVSVVLCLEYVRRRIPELHLRREDWRITRDDVSRHLRMGLPMGFQASIIAIGTLAVQIRLNALGAEAVAAYTAASRVDSLAAAFLQSLGLAASMFVAQNFGAGRGDRIRLGVKQATLMSVIGSVGLGLVMVFFGVALVRMFVGDGADDVVALAHYMLVVNGCTYSLLGVLFVLRGALQGLGDAMTPTVTGIVELGMRLLAAVVFGAWWGFEGVVWSNPLAWIGAIVILVPVYLRKRLALSKIPPAPLGTTTMAIPVIGPSSGSHTVETVVTQPITLPAQKRVGRRAKR